MNGYAEANPLIALFMAITFNFSTGEIGWSSGTTATSAGGTFDFMDGNDLSFMNGNTAAFMSG